MAFAEKTEVSVEKSRAEIEGLLMKYGADKFMSGYDLQGSGRAVIGFRCAGRQIRFTLMLPDRSEHRFTHVKYKGRHYEEQRTELRAAEAYEQERRRLWRALALVIKAKLEAVASGITTFDVEFMPHVVMPDGKTVAEHVAPAIVQAYESGKMPPLLLGMGETSP